MSSEEPRPRYRHGAVGLQKKLYVWGGLSDTKIRPTSMETFDVATETWEQPQQLEQCSLPDTLWGMATANDGENIYFFGGRSGSRANSPYFNTLYQINPSTRHCKELVPGNPSNAPMKKSGSRMVYFKQKLVLHGGCIGQERTDELHLFDLNTSEWSAQSTTGDKPPPLECHTFTMIDDHRAVVFGGYTGSSRRNDTYILDMETWHWIKLKVSGVKPPPRYTHATCYVAGPLTGQEHPILLVFGGRGVGKTIGDMWLLDVDKKVWREVSRQTPLAARDGHSVDVFGCGPSFRALVLFGGLEDAEEPIYMSETTLVSLELRGGLWQVTNIVVSDELGKPEERLKEQMRKLYQEGGHHEDIPPPPDHAIGSSGRNERPPPDPIGTKSDASSIIDVKEVHIGKSIGQGGFGAVYEAKWQKKRVAVKVCLGNLLKNKSHEIDILTNLPTHPNVITFFGVAISEDNVNTYIITELAPNGSLYNYLHVKKEKPSPDQSFAWALQVASAMQHLHKNDTVHRDLKSGNVLLSFGLFAKVCDFGTARTLAESAMTTQKGTYRWMAPEIMKAVEANINKMCDVYSYGMILYEVFAHKLPYDDLPTDAMVGMAVLQGERPPIPSTLPQFLHPVLEACWKEEPELRPQFDAIVLAIQTEFFE